MWSLLDFLLSITHTFTYTNTHICRGRQSTVLPTTSHFSSWHPSYLRGLSRSSSWHPWDWRRLRDSAPDTLGAREDPIISGADTLGIEDDSVISAPGALGIGADSLISAPRTWDWVCQIDWY